MSAHRQRGACRRCRRGGCGSRARTRRPARREAPATRSRARYKGKGGSNAAPDHRRRRGARPRRPARRRLHPAARTSRLFFQCVCHLSRAWARSLRRRRCRSCAQTGGSAWPPRCAAGCLARPCGWRHSAGCHGCARACRSSAWRPVWPGTCRTPGSRHGPCRRRETVQPERNGRAVAQAPAWTDARCGRGRSCTALPVD